MNDRNLPKPRFECDQIVRTPIAVCESQQARIVGREWGPDNVQLRIKGARDGWVYTLVEASLRYTLGRDFLATEAELVAWQKSSKRNEP